MKNEEDFIVLKVLINILLILAAIAALITVIWPQPVFTLIVGGL